MLHLNMTLLRRGIVPQICMDYTQLFKKHLFQNISKLSFLKHDILAIKKQSF